MNANPTNPPDFDGYTCEEALQFFGQELTEFEKVEL
jgi:hypothetical protein